MPRQKGHPDFSSQGADHRLEGVFGADEGTQHLRAADEGQSAPERELVRACASWA